MSSEVIKNQYVTLFICSSSSFSHDKCMILKVFEIMNETRTFYNVNQ